MRLKVDVIVTGGPSATRAAKEATSTIPIVMTQDLILLAPGSSPASRDLVETLLDCPTLAPELGGKQLELLKEIVPRLSRVAVLGNSTQPGNAEALREIGTRRRDVRSAASIPRRTKS